MSDNFHLGEIGRRPGLCCVVVDFMTEKLGVEDFPIETKLEKSDGITDHFSLNWKQEAPDIFSLILRGESTEKKVTLYSAELELIRHGQGEMEILRENFRGYDNFSNNEIWDRLIYMLGYASVKAGV